MGLLKAIGKNWEVFKKRSHFIVGDERGFESERRFERW